MMRKMGKRPARQFWSMPLTVLATFALAGLVMLAVTGVGQAQGNAGTPAKPEITLHSCDTGCLVVAVGNMPEYNPMVETRWRLTGETEWQEWDYIDHNPNTRRGSRRTDVDGHLEIQNLPAGTYEVQARFYDPNDVSGLSEWSEVASLATETWPSVTNLLITFPEDDNFNAILSWTAPSSPEYDGYYVNVATECEANALQHHLDVTATSVTIEVGRAHGPLGACVRPHLGGQSANAIASKTVPGAPNHVTFAFGEIRGSAMAPEGAETDWSPLLPFDEAYLSWRGDTYGLTILESEWKYRKQGSTTEWSNLTAVSSTRPHQWAVVDTAANAMEVNAQYEFRVRSRSQDGWGQWSFPYLSEYEPKSANPTPVRNIRIKQPRGDDPQSRWVVEWDAPTSNGGHVCGQFSTAMRDWIFDHAPKDVYVVEVLQNGVWVLDIDRVVGRDYVKHGHDGTQPVVVERAKRVTFVPTEAMKTYLLAYPTQNNDGTTRVVDAEDIIVRPIGERPANWCERFDKSERIRYEVYILGASYVRDEHIRRDGDRRVSFGREHVELPVSGLMTVRITAYGVCADCDPTDGPPPYDSTVRSDAEATYTEVVAPGPPQSLTVRTTGGYDVWWGSPDSDGGRPIMQYRFDGICGDSGFTSNISLGKHELWSVDNGHVRLHFPPVNTFHLKMSKSACSRFDVTAINELGYSSETVKWEETPNGVPVITNALPDLNLVARIPQGSNAQPHPLEQANFAKIAPLSGPAGVFDDPDNDALTYTLTSSDPFVAHAEVRNQPYSHIYVVAKDTPGNATITVAVNDGKGGMAQQRFLVSVRSSFNPLVYDRNGDGLIDRDEYQQARSDYGDCYGTPGWNDHDNPLECRTGETSYPYLNLLTVKELFERTNQKVVPKWDNQTGSKTVGESAGDVELCIEETAGLEVDIFPSVGYDDDFTLTPHVLPYTEQGEQQWCATVTVTDDSFYEPNETIAFLVIGELDDGTKVGGYATLKILDNDGSPVKVDPLDLEIVAGQTATYTVSLSSEPTSEMIVEAAAPAGMTVTPPSRLIHPHLWERPVTFTVSSSNAGTGVIDNTVTPAGGSVAYGTAQVRVSVLAQQRQSPVNHAPTVASPIADIDDLSAGDQRLVLLSSVFSYDGNGELEIRAGSNDSAKATVTVSPDYSSLTVTGVSAGTATIGVTAQDPDGDLATDEFDVTVVGPGQQQAAPPKSQGTGSAPKTQGPEPTNVQVAGGDGAVTVSWDVSPFYYKERLIESERIKHALRWWIGTGWANPRGTNAIGRNDGIHVENGVTSYTINGLTNGVGVEVHVRAFFGSNYTEGAMNKGASSTSSTWVKAVGTPQVPNNAPTISNAIDDETIVNESGTYQVLLTGVFADADQDTLTITAKSSDTAVATAAISQNTLTVTAKKRGTTTITVTASDGKAKVSDAFTVTVKGAPVVATAFRDITGLEIGDTRTVPVSSAFSDPDGDTLTYIARSSSTSVVVINVSVDGTSSGTVVAMAAGTATITVTAEDSDGNSVSDSFDVTVNAAPQQQQEQHDPPPKAEPPNNAPTVTSAIDDATIVNESGTHRVSLSGVFADADEDSLTITATSSNEQAATVSVSADYATLTASAQSRGTATITVTANDGQSGTVADKFDVKVKATPTVAAAIPDMLDLVAGVVPDFIDLSEDGSGSDVQVPGGVVDLSQVFRDADGDDLTYSVNSADIAVATVTELLGFLSIVPDTAGTATVVVTAEDSDGNSTTDSFDIQVLNPPGPVTNLSLSATFDSVTVSWDTPTTGGTPDGYIVHIGREGGGDGATKRPGKDDTSVTFNGLNSGSTYKVWARAQNADGKGERVRDEITLPDAPAPGTVLNLNVSADAGNVTVSWQAPQTGGAPDGYIVHISPEDGGKGRTKTPKAKKTQVAFKNLEVGRTYQVWVRAQNEAGKGERVHATITLPE